MRKAINEPNSKRFWKAKLSNQQRRAQQIEWTLGVGRGRALMSQTNNEVWWVDRKIEKVNKWMHCQLQKLAQLYKRMSGKYDTEIYKQENKALIQKHWNNQSEIGKCIYDLLDDWRLMRLNSHKTLQLILFS